DNAVKYSPEGTAIRCSLGHETGNWVVSIQDQGRGMTAYQQQALFTPFARFDEDKPNNPSGIGLGMAFVSTVITRHGGSIQVVSQEDKGSIFHIRLPEAA